MALFAGTSGWAYPEWRPAFYPAGEPSGRMLASYAGHFSTVEVNNTFYRTPKPEALAGWRDAVPPGFRFAFKAPRFITHRRSFAETAEPLDRFAGLLELVGERLGPVLFQLEVIADVPQLDRFLGLAKARFSRVVMEFRHATWLTEETFDVLRRHDAALCQTETDDGCDPSVAASDFTYLRLRRSTYTSEELEERLDSLAELAHNRDVFCYLKHDVENAVLLRDWMARRGQNRASPT